MMGGKAGGQEDDGDGNHEPLLPPEAVDEEQGLAGEDKLNDYPKEHESSILSRVLFLWLNPYIWTGFRRRLELNDQLTPPPYIDQEVLYRCFEPAWEKECRDRPPGKRSLARVLWRLYRWRWFFAFVFCCISYAFLLLGPLITRQLIVFLRHSHTEVPPPPLSDGLRLVGILFIVNLADACIKSASMFHIKMVGTGIRALLVTCVFRKSLVLAPSAWRATSVSRIVNQVSSEASWLLNVFPGLMNLLCAPLMVVVIAGVIYWMIGPSILLGLAIMLAYVPVMRCVGRRQKMAQAAKQHAGDDRIKVANEAIQGAKVIKLYAWTGAVSRRIQAKRQEEAACLRRFSVLRAASVALTTLVPLLSLLATFAGYYFLNGGRSPDLQDVYTVIALFKLLMLPFKTCSEGITSLASLQVALKRFQAFLELPEGGTLPALPGSVAAGGGGGGDVGLHIKGDFAWDKKGPPTLRNLDIKVKRGELVAMVGAVGSGKSSIISAAMGEMDAVGGGGSGISGSVALVAQQAFIMNATLRENILLGSLLDSHRYQRAIEASALRPDLQVLPDGDMTEIGSKGINLSGGQRARISLARACYNDPDVILLDDPLSAVDAHVARHLWDHLLSDEWGGDITTTTTTDQQGGRNSSSSSGGGGGGGDNDGGVGSSSRKRRKCVLLTTNQLSFLREPRVSRIIVLDQGAVVQEGSFAELMVDVDGPFAKLAASLDLKHEEEEGEQEEQEDDEATAAVMIKSRKEGGDKQKPPATKNTSITHNNDSKTGDRVLAASASSPSLRLAKAEGRHEGAVSMATYVKYLGAFGSWPYVAIMLINFMVVEGVTSGQDWFLGQWASDGLRLLPQDYMKWYGVAVGCIAGLVLLRGVMFALFSVKSASSMHGRAMSRVLGSPMSFFDTQPIGRILNRFSQDVNSLDVDLPTNLEMFLVTWSRVVSVVVLSCVPQPLFVVFLFPMFIVFHFLKELYRRSSREAQRLYSITWSPVLGNLEQTLAGLTTLRAYRAERYVDEQFMSSCRANNSFAFAKSALDQWIFTQLSFLCALVMSGSALGVILTREQVSPALAGLAFASTLTLIVELRFGVRYATQVEAQLNSVDRLDEYGNLPQEPPLHLPMDDRLPDTWPPQGGLHFRGLSLRYRPGLPQVLKRLEVEVRGGTKVGIVGRTGSGKSSLLLGLFRILEPDEGTVELDGVDIRALGLDRLRRLLAIVPQDPVMFSGSIRENLDPFGEYPDEEVWWALDRCGMNATVRRLPGGLSEAVHEHGANFSVGERQLLCMGRALLRRAKVLVLDEATASVDPTTDQLIQHTIRTSFQGCTVIAVAHRVRTIMDYDRIMVLDRGTLLEYGSPQELLTRGSEGSMFASMAQHSGIGIATRSPLPPPPAAPPGSSGP